MSPAIPPRVRMKPAIPPRVRLTPAIAHDFGPDLAPLGELVAVAFPSATRDLVIEPMAGGASTRKYYRVKLGGRSAVAMFVPHGSQPEEFMNGAACVSGQWPFLEVRDSLAERGVDVPALYAHDTARGWILLEDLGDQTLAAFLQSHPESKAELYTRAVRDLAQAQRAFAEWPDVGVIGRRVFDAELLVSEIQHFREWALEARGLLFGPGERAVFDGVAERLARRIALWPRAFVHRDYQSRNLMVRGGAQLCWLDFQDALLGPRVYDLVALLNDSYQVFDRPFVEARLDDFADSAGMRAEDRLRLGLEFDLVTVQRKLKDAGRFVYIDRVKGNGSFLKFVEPTLAKAQASLARLTDDPDMRTLAELLMHTLSG